MRGALTAALALALALPLSASARDLDWCAPVVVSPDQTYRNDETPATGEIQSACFPTWHNDTVASYADVAYLIGTNFDGTTAAPGSPSWKVTQDHYPVTCWGSRIGSASNEMSWTNIATWLASLNARRPPGMAALKTVLRMRSELISAREMVLTGFDPSWLVTTSTAWSVPTFFSAGGATWHDGNGYFNGSTPPACQYAGGTADRQCLRELVCQAAGAAANCTTEWQGKVYYVNNNSHPSYWPSAAVAKMNSSGYRAWKVAQAQAALAATGATHVELSHKLWMWAQHLAPDSGCAWPDNSRWGNSWLGSACATDLASYRANGSDAEFSAQPATGYGYPEYVAGLGDLADDLATAGVPFVWLSARTYFGTPAPSGSGGGGAYTPSDFGGTTRLGRCTADNVPWACCDGPAAGTCTGDFLDDPASGANEVEEIRRIALEKADVVLLDAQQDDFTATETLATAIRQGSGSPEVIVMRASGATCNYGKGLPFAMPWK